MQFSWTADWAVLLQNCGLPANALENQLNGIEDSGRFGSVI